MLAKQWRPPVLSDRQKKMMSEKKEEVDSVHVHYVIIVIHFTFKVEEEPDEGTNTEVMDRIREAMLAEAPERTPSPSPPPTPPPPQPPKVCHHYDVHVCM